MEANNQLGTRIRSIRHQLGLTLEGLAEKTGLSPSYLGEIERGEKKPSLTTVEKIADAFEMSFSRLFEYTGFGSYDRYYVLPEYEIIIEHVRNIERSFDSLRDYLNSLAPPK